MLSTQSRTAKDGGGSVAATPHSFYSPAESLKVSSADFIAKLTMLAMFEDLKELRSVRDLCGRTKSRKSCSCAITNSAHSSFFLSCICSVVLRGHLSSNKLLGPKNRTWIKGSTTTQTNQDNDCVTDKCQPFPREQCLTRRKENKTHLEGCVWHSWAQWDYSSTAETMTGIPATTQV